MFGCWLLVDWDNSDFYDDVKIGGRKQLGESMIRLWESRQIGCFEVCVCPNVFSQHTQFPVVIPAKRTSLDQNSQQPVVK